MQNIASEMNLSETAFLLKMEDGFSLRWFTPKLEVELCGHATLASAHVLWEEAILTKEEKATFHTLSGPIEAQQNGEWIEMDFPSEPEHRSDVPPELIDALGVTPKYVGKNRFDYSIEVQGESEVIGIRPDFTKLASVPVRGVMVTARSLKPDYDFLSRFFAPNCGVNEDPVTGSAHCCLGPFWGKRLNKRSLVGHQASERGGTVLVRLDGERVHLGGKAVTITKGELVLYRTMS